MNLIELKNAVEIDDMIFEGLVSNTSTSNAIPSEPLTMDHIMKAVDMIEAAVSKNPFQLFAKENGFDLNAGDSMIIPKGFADLHGITGNECKGVIVSEYIDCSIVFFKDQTGLPYAR